MKALVAATGQFLAENNTTTNGQQKTSTDTM